MREEIAIAGAGGQGVLVMGKLISHASFLKGLHVAFVQQYSPYVRGGWVSCNLAVSDAPVVSPVADRFDTVVVFDPVSYVKFAPLRKPDGLLIWNNALIHVNGSSHPGKGPELAVPVNQCATELGNLKLMNMVMLGAYCAYRKWLTVEDVIAVLKKTLPPRRHALIPLNEQALRRGAQLQRAAVA